MKKVPSLKTKGSKAPAVSVNGEVVDVTGKVVVVRVEDLTKIEGEDFIASELKRAGATLVFFADKTATLETLEDGDLAKLGLKKL